MRRDAGVLKAPEHEEYEHYLDWVGEDFVSGRFDVDKMNCF